MKTIKEIIKKHTTQEGDEGFYREVINYDAVREAITTISTEIKIVMSAQLKDPRDKSNTDWNNAIAHIDKRLQYLLQQSLASLDGEKEGE